MIVLSFLPLFLSFFLFSSFLVMNILDWRLAAGDLLYNLNVRNSCGFLTCAVLVFVTFFISLFFLIHFLGIGKGSFNLFKVRSGVSCQPVYIVCFLSVCFPLIDMRYSIILSYLRICRLAQFFMLNLVKS